MRFTSHSLLAVLVLSIAAFGQSINLDTQVKGSRLPMWGVDSGSANAYAIATIGALGPSLRTGSRFAFIATHANTTASTLAVDGGSTIAIKKNVSAALVSGDIALNQVIEVTYDGTNFQIVGPGALTFSAISGTLGCSQLPTFTGDVTNSACAMTLASVVTAGSCGDATHSCGLTYDVKGRITAATNNVISGGGGGGGSNVGICTASFSTLTGWTWANQGTSTATISSNVLTFTGQNASGQDQVRFIYQTAPATPWTKTMCYAPDLHANSSVRTYMAVSDGTKIITLGFRPNELDVFHFNTLTNSFSSTLFASTIYVSNPIAVQITDDGTSLIFSLCPDGNANHCDLLAQESRTSFLSSVSQVGIAAEGVSTLSPVFYVYSFQ